MLCPRPLTRHTTIQMAHGGGGRAMRQLIEQIFVPAFDNDRHDSAVVAVDGGRLAFTTDTYVIRPRFFPGGDIGKLAVYGTVNDLAMSGAVPRWLSVGMVLEEGLPLDELRRIVESMRDAALECGVRIVTGDTKVVDRGKGDGIFINTAGIGTVAEGVDVHPRRVAVGDAVIVSGDLGRHGVAVMSVREGIAFDTAIESDCAPLHGLVAEMLIAGDVHCLRDLTRGGLASALNEIAMDAGVDIELDERHLRVAPAVGAACEMLGLDPLYVANEGRLVAFVDAASAPRMVEVMGGDAAVVGRVTGRASGDGSPGGRVTMRGAIGALRLLDLLSGEQLPRIC